MSQENHRYAICTYTKGDEHLVAWKVYQVLLDEQAAEDEYARVIDESGEDYLYPADFFVPLELPKKVERALAAPAKPAPRLHRRPERSPRAHGGLGVKASR
jgi:hypothetical protein